MQIGVSSQLHARSPIIGWPVQFESNGPARTITHNRYGNRSFDHVDCTRCLWWPTQAADWPTRQRNYGWPDSATVDRVVSNGCDVVSVAHRLCRHDEWENTHQFRLSFSRAEIVLLNSWTRVQQIVYHMLRVFVKTERLTHITDSTGAKILSNYHIKTLMLWACELKPRSWWIDNVNVIRICVVLLHSFGDWLKNANCPHYFVNNCNLTDTSLHLKIIASQLVSITKPWLSMWFLNNYVWKCAQLCPDGISQLFDDVGTSKKLQNAVSAVVDWRLNNALHELFGMHGTVRYLTISTISSASRFLPLYDRPALMNELAKIDSCLCVYFNAVIFLHVAHRAIRKGLNDRWIDVLTTTLGQSVDKRRSCNQLSSVLSLSQATKMMKVVANDSHSTVQLIEIELSKAYLYRALRCKDSDSDSIYCLANVYLAVLYYTTGRYQTAIDHCTLVTRSQDHSQCSSHVVQGELLPKIDDDIDTVLGLSVFYQYVRTAALNQRQQTQHVSVFTTELFAHYLHIRCLSVTKFTQMSSNNEVHCYIKSVNDSKLSFIADVLSLKLTQKTAPKCHNKSPTEHRQRIATGLNATVLDTSELIELLEQSAVEQLTIYRQLEEQKFGSVFPIVTTDFEALYEYKRGDYQQCLQLSIQNGRKLWRSEYMTDFQSYPEFVKLLDDDIVSLIALTLIVDPECRNMSTNCVIDQLTLSLYLITQCKLKLHHSVTSLARTLDCIERKQKRCNIESTLIRLIQKLIERKLVTHLTQNM